MRIIVVLATCVVAALAVPAPVVTPQQYEKSVKMLRNICQPKTGITVDIIERIKNGELVEEKIANCYLACIMNTIMVLKNNKVDGKMFRMQAKKMMTPEIAAKTVAAFDICEPLVESQPDQCDTVLMFLRCMKKNEPTFIPPA